MLHLEEMFAERAGKVFAKRLIGLTSQMKADYLASGLKATGFYGENIKWLVEQEDGRLIARIEVPHYAEQMTFGRPPAAEIRIWVAYEDILDWVEVKPGLPPVGWTPESFAFVVTKNINEFGIEVPNRFNPGDIVTKSIESFVENDLQKLLDELGIEAVNTIESDLIPDILERFKQAQK